MASPSEYDRRRPPCPQASTASFLGFLSPPAHGGYGGPLTRGSQAPICSPLSVSHALRGLLPPKPLRACSIPLTLLGFRLEDSPVSGLNPSRELPARCSLSGTGDPKVPGSDRHIRMLRRATRLRRKATPGMESTSKPTPLTGPPSPADEGRILAAAPIVPQENDVFVAGRRTGQPSMRLRPPCKHSTPWLTSGVRSEH